MSFLISHVRDATGIFFHYSYNCCDFITIFENLCNGYLIEWINLV